MKLQKQKHKIPSARSTRAMQLSSLRPGDWLRHDGITRAHTCYVIQNWPSIGRLELGWSDGKPLVLLYSTVSIGSAWTYLGRGQKRRWVAALPAMLRNLFAPYSKP
jgi:hypothetical protein